MLSKVLETTLNRAIQYAHQSRHEFVTVEHLLAAMIDDEVALEIFAACDVDVNLLKEDLDNFLKDQVPLLPDDDNLATQPGVGFQRVLQRAILHVQSSGKKEVNSGNVLVAIFAEQESHAVYFLNKQDVRRLDVVNFISHGISKRMEAGSTEHLVEDEEVQDEEKSKNPLEQFARNLNEMANEGRIDPLIGRELEVERTIQILCRRRKNNPLYVGEAGVGKTAIAEGLAKKIHDQQVPEILSESTIWALDLGALLAGTKYRGDFEQRLKGVLKELKKDPEAILFIDEIHTLIGAGAASGGAMDASNILKPLLSTGEIKCIGSTTFQEYRNIFEKDRALSRRFQKIDVTEPTIAETIDILKGLKSRFEAHHQVTYTNDAIQTAAELASRYINDRFMPDKAIDVIDEAGARTHLAPEGNRKNVVDVTDVEIVVAKMARIPPKQVSSSDKDSLKTLERDLKMVVFGQDKAIETLSSAVKLARSGLGNPDKPTGAFLFSGPTGVGKTEVTKQLAHVMGIELIRFDMSEYMERHSVARLIGAPPGYVGFDQGGLLTDAVTKNPHAVLLLDEIEKAHPDVFNLLLQVMDHGTLTDNNGRKADFRNVIIVMTTNAGAEVAARASIGFAQQDHSSDDTEVIKKTFSPEFRNRLDGIIRFNSLDEKTIMHIVDKFIMQLEEQLADKNVSISLDNKARQWLATNGYDKAMGARPMERLIQDKVKRALADELLFGQLSNGGEVSVTVSDEKDDLSFHIGTDLLEHNPDEAEAIH